MLLHEGDKVGLSEQLGWTGLPVHHLHGAGLKAGASTVDGEGLHRAADVVVRPLPGAQAQTTLCSVTWCGGREHNGPPSPLCHLFTPAIVGVHVQIVSGQDYEAVGHEALLRDVDLHGGLLALGILGAAGQEVADDELVQSLLVPLWGEEEP